MPAQPLPEPAPEVVLAKAVLRAAAQLGLKQAELAAVLGMHRTAISRLKQRPALDPQSKAGELALLLVRLAGRCMPSRAVTRTGSGTSWARQQGDGRHSGAADREHPGAGDRAAVRRCHPGQGVTIWEACQGPEQIRRVAGVLFRMVESQEQVATLGYVDTLEEQALLEQMLDEVKPPYRPDTDGLHYLLRTPFRYPPLRWGSRFGRIHEPGIFYGGCGTDATLAEAAYYRFVFWYSMDAAPVKEAIRSEHTLFSAAYRSERGIKLHEPPFSAFSAAITHPADYAQTQLLGTAMREAGVDAFEYPSARDPQRGLCVGLFYPPRSASPSPASRASGCASLVPERCGSSRSGTRMCGGLGSRPFLLGVGWRCRCRSAFMPTGAFGRVLLSP